MVLGLFKTKKAFDATIFEQELDFLAEQINDSHNQQLKLDVSRRKIESTFIEITGLVYFLVLAYMYYTTSGWNTSVSRWRNFGSNQSYERWAFLVGYPLVLILIVKLMSRFFAALKRRQKARHVSLKKQRDAKIEQMKKETNYNSIHNVLNKYGGGDKAIDNSRSPSVAVSKPVPSDGANSTGLTHAQQEIQRQMRSQQLRSNPQPKPKQSQQQQQQHSGSVQSPSPIKPSPQAVPPTPRTRTFQDRVLDLIIGSENNESIENRFALICVRCNRHNGLAPPGCTHPWKVRYICPQCGYTNGQSEEEIQGEKQDDIAIEGKQAKIEDFTTDEREAEVDIKSASGNTSTEVESNSKPELKLEDEVTNNL
ncbi:hypothetical protein CAAN3_15S03598 [[Candida] anglica]